MIKKCEVCGREFEAKRKTARFCSSTCRSRSFRGYEYRGEQEPPAIRCAMTDDDIAAAVQDAHAAARNLSRAAMFATSPLCLRLASAAHGMEKALGEEGL